MSILLELWSDALVYNKGAMLVMKKDQVNKWQQLILLRNLLNTIRKNIYLLINEMWQDPNLKF